MKVLDYNSCVKLCQDLLTFKFRGQWLCRHEVKPQRERVELCLIASPLMFVGESIMRGMYALVTVHLWEIEENQKRIKVQKGYLCWWQVVVVLQWSITTNLLQNRFESNSLALLWVVNRAKFSPPQQPVNGRRVICISNSKERFLWRRLYILV